MEEDQADMVADAGDMMLIPPGLKLAKEETAEEKTRRELEEEGGDWECESAVWGRRDRLRVTVACEEDVCWVVVPVVGSSSSSLDLVVVG